MSHASPELVLYHGLASTCSKKVRMCLYEKQLLFKSRLLNLQKFEQHDPEYLRLNPNGVVPTLVHNGRPVIESSVIVEYIDDQWPIPPLMPADNYGKAQVRLWLKFSDDVAYGAVATPTWDRVSRPVASKLTEGELEEVLARIPTAERRNRWLKAARSGFTEEDFNDARDRMHKCFSRIEEALEHGPWLAGAQFTLADIAMIPFIDRIRNLEGGVIRSGICPRLNDWYESMSTRPSFDRAFDFKDDPRVVELVNI
jgi:glutathione S-transferase